ncbi:MAG: hypothetical protein ACYC25_06295, partial [Paludibacter sp.]
MKKLSLLMVVMFATGFVIAQNSADVILSGVVQTSNILQTGDHQVALVVQEGITNEVLVEQISGSSQYAWVFQSGEITDDAVPADNHATVDQKYSGAGNLSFLYQYGSHNKSWQTQNGSNNKFNIAGNFPSDPDNIRALPTDAVPNQDGDYHQNTQTANGDFNQAWVYQAGRYHVSSQVLTGNENQVWTSQSGNTNKSEMIINGNGNGSIWMEHEEGKFPEPEGEVDEGPDNVGGNGEMGEHGGQGDGGMPDVIPPPHDETHVFVPTVGVSIKQMGKNSIAEMDIEGSYNKATITQRGGAGGNDSEQGGGHYANQDITGDYNRVFADQTGTGNHIDQDVYGTNNLVTFMQKGNGGISVIDLDGASNEIGVDQKGKSNYSRIDVEGNFNGNLLAGDDYGVKLAQEGKENHSEIDIIGNYNFVNAHQSGGGVSYITQTGD